MLKFRDKSVYSTNSLSRLGLDQDPVLPPPLENGSRSAASSRLSGISRMLKKAFANDSQATPAVIANTLEVPSSLDLPKDPAEYRDHIIQALSLDITSSEAGIVDLTNHLARGRLVSSGGYGDIYLASWGYSPSSQLPLLAIKIMRVVRSQDERENAKRMKLLKREVKVWQELKHTNILPLIGIACLDGDINFPAIVSPWMEYGTIIDYIRRNPSVPIVKFMGEVIDGLNYLHRWELPTYSREFCSLLLDYRPQIIHGDLKGSNVLVDYRGHVYIGDFGLSRMMEDASLWDTSATQAAGSIRWMAPELLTGHDSRATTASDVYSYAMTCFEMLSGNVPFSRFRMDGAVATAVVVRNERPERSLVPHAPTTLWKIISDCWDADPARRPRTRAVVKALKVERESGFPSSMTQQHLGLVLGLDGLLMPKCVDLEMIACFPKTTHVLAVGRGGLFLGDLQDLRYFAPKKVDITSHLEHPKAVAYAPLGTMISGVGVQIVTNLIAIACDTGVYILTINDSHVSGLGCLSESEYLPFISVAISPDASMVAAGSKHGRVMVWDTFIGSIIHKFRREPYSGRVSCVAFSHCGKLLATAASVEDAPVTIRTIPDGSVRCRLRPHRGSSQASAIAFSPITDLLIIGYNEGSVIFWDTISFHVIHTIGGSGYIVRSLSFSPNGRLIASASSDGKIVIINAGAAFGSRWAEYSDDVQAVAFASNARLVSGSARSGEIRVWDMKW